MYPSVVPLALEPHMDPWIQGGCKMYPPQLHRHWNQFWLHGSEEVLKYICRCCIGIGSTFRYMDPKGFQHVSISGSIGIGTTFGSIDTFVMQSIKNT